MDHSRLLKRIRTLTHPLDPIPSKYEPRLKPLYGIGCIAFDFYGTMFLSGVGDIGIDEEQQNDAPVIFTKALEESGFDLLDQKAGERGIILFKKHIERYIAAARNNGIDYPEAEIREIWREVLTTLQRNNFIEGQLNRETITNFGIEFEFRANNLWPAPNLEPALSSILDLDLELGIISNSQFYTPIAFEATLGKAPEAFGFNANLLIWSFKIGRKKPSLHFYEAFVDAAKHEGLKPQQVLYIGNDIRKDIKPAKSLGMKTALYVGDQRSIRHEPYELDKQEHKPDLIIDDLLQIPDCLKF